MKEVKLIRGPQDQRQTLGIMICEGFKLYTLELPWKNNEFQKSCIPTGEYICEPRFSEKYKKHFILKGVPNRTYILIHAANYVRQLLGCIGVGLSILDIDKDGLNDITSSRAALDKLIRTYPEGFKLIIE